MKFKVRVLYNLPLFSLLYSMRNKKKHKYLHQSFLNQYITDIGEHYVKKYTHKTLNQIVSKHHLTIQTTNVITNLVHLCVDDKFVEKYIPRLLTIFQGY